MPTPASATPGDGPRMLRALVTRARDATLRAFDAPELRLGDLHVHVAHRAQMLVDCLRDFRGCDRAHAL